MKASVIHVLGANRSGTTITHLMLANDPNAFACGELFSVFRPWRKEHFEPGCNCGKSESDCLWPTVMQKPESLCHKTISEITGARWIVDESKVLPWVIDSQNWCLQSEMNIYHLLLYKDPLDLMYSYWKTRGKLSGFLDYWKHYYGRFIKLNVPFVAINFNALQRNPGETLNAICHTIGMPYFEGKERFWEKQHCYLFGNPGVRRQLLAHSNEIHPPRSLPPDFQGFSAASLDEFKRDTAAEVIWRKIQENQLFEASALDGQSAHIKGSSLPAWYYIDKARLAYRRRFPLETSHIS